MLGQEEKGTFYIDKPISNITFDKTIQIDGWWMSTDKNATMKILIDGKDTKANVSKRLKRPDVISAIKGYGEESTNPLPGFQTSIDVSSYQEGNYTLTYQLQSERGTILKEEKKSIIIDHSIKGTFDIDTPNPYRGVATIKENSLNIYGWIMATNQEVELKVSIDEQATNAKISRRTARPDVIAAIHGYGDISTNPQPGFEMTIDMSQYKSGNHKIKYELQDKQGKVIAKKEGAFVLQKGQFEIDTPNPYLKNTKITENLITVKGWYLASSPNSTIKVKMDGKEVSLNHLKRTTRPDVLAAIPGYGGAGTNPKPGFEATINLTGYKSGEHEIIYQLIDETGEVLASKKTTIILQKGQFEIDTPNPYIKNTKITENLITIKGWYLASSPNSTIKVKMDGKEVSLNQLKRTTRPDVLAAIPGYGGAGTNPKPGFEATINLTGYKSGEHEIIYQLIDETGEVLASKKTTIVLQKGQFDIDTPNPYIKNNKITESIIKVNGWLLASNPNSTIKIQIDGNEIPNVALKRTKRPDVLSAISGYGGEKNNPLPGFELNLNVSNYKSGQHEIIYQLVDETGEVLASKKATILIKKGQFDIDTPHNQYAFYGKKIDIQGWFLSTDKNATMKVLIDGKDTNAKIQKRTARPDVLAAIKGYGGASTNPLPGFHMTIDILPYTVGKHTLEYQLITLDGEIIEKRTLNITIDNIDRGTMYIESPARKDVEYSVYAIQGWEMSTYPDSKIEIKVDGKTVPTNVTRVNRQDVLQAIKNFGDKSTNPKPGFYTYVDFTKYDLGEHTLEVILISSEGKQLDKVEKEITIFKNITHGIDVSEFNGYVDWRAVKQTQDFAMIRVGYRGYRNPRIVPDAQFYRNIEGAQSVGMACGIYFFSQAITEWEAIEEANWVVDMVSRYNIRYPIAFDTEWSSGNHDGRADYIDLQTRTNVAKAFCQTIRNRGYTPAIYASRDWFYYHLDRNQLTDFDTWVAHYTGDINKKTNYQGAYSMWQYTSSGWVNGVEGRVDRNICYKRYI